MGLPLAVLNCSSSDPDPSGDGGGGGAAATSSGTTTTSTGTDSTSSSSSSTSSATSGSGGAGGAGDGGGGVGGDAAGGGEPSGAFTLTSPNHAEGAEFADKYTCAAAGFNNSLLPELNWTAGPPGTKSYAITFIDVTLAARMEANGYHWVIYNIPPDVTSLPEEFKNAASIQAMQNREYLGPCPNFGGGSANTDTYEFTIYALAEASVTIAGTGTAAVMDAEKKLEMKNLAKTKLTGTSNASPP